MTHHTSIKGAATFAARNASKPQRARIGVAFMSNLSLHSSATAGRRASPDAPIVLVVEDDVSVRQVVWMLLEDLGYQVVTAVDGLDGLQKFHKIKPDVVLTDIIMPEKEGIGLITEMRHIRKDVKIIAMSGGGRIGNMDFVSVAVALGANIGLRKPFDNDELASAVRTLLEPAQAARAQALVA
jgi:DNA-binding response OmpR family regulator